MSAPVVLVTGAAGALGTAVARGFERDGARVVPAGRDEVDITDAAAVAAFVARVLAEHGRIDALVHVAGGFEMGETVDAISRASWERMMDLNAWSFVALAAPVVAQMKRQGNGRIVAVSAAAAGAGQALKGATSLPRARCSGWSRRWRRNSPAAASPSTALPRPRWTRRPTAPRCPMPTRRPG